MVSSALHHRLIPRGAPMAGLGERGRACMLGRQLGEYADREELKPLTDIPRPTCTDGGMGGEPVDNPSPWSTTRARTVCDAVRAVASFVREGGARTGRKVTGACMCTDRTNF